MRTVGTAAGWAILEQNGTYYVRLEQVVALLSGSGAAREVLAAVLRDSPEPDDADG